MEMEILQSTLTPKPEPQTEPPSPTTPARKIAIVNLDLVFELYWMLYEVAHNHFHQLCDVQLPNSALEELELQPPKTGMRRLVEFIKKMVEKEEKNEGKREAVLEKLADFDAIYRDIDKKFTETLPVLKPQVNKLNVL
jgi:hypothetical protein